VTDDFLATHIEVVEGSTLIIHGEKDAQVSLTVKKLVDIVSTLCECSRHLLVWSTGHETRPILS
jgi:hypothetical protein